MTDAALYSTVTDVPTGAWAVAVSGGADSVALLTLLVEARPDLSLHVVHLNHQTRGGESDGDAAFVADLARSMHLPVTIATLADIRPTLTAAPANPSALFRAARLALFGKVVASGRMQGVIVGHHRLDQAETVLLRLMRGVGPVALTGMARIAHHGSLTLLRPLLNVEPVALRQWLRRRGQAWREDASNRSGSYRRNRVRGMLSRHRELVEDLVRLAESCRAVAEWAGEHSPVLPDWFRVDGLDGLPLFFRQHAARQWLKRAGVPAGEADGAVADRLLAMSDDATTPAVIDFPGDVRVRRKGGVVFTESRPRVAGDAAKRA
jgi:tRNA(Ile)-lysidine synthetase-like protein